MLSNYLSIFEHFTFRKRIICTKRECRKSAAISGFTSAGIYIDSNILNNKAVRSVAHKILVDIIKI